MPLRTHSEIITALSQYRAEDIKGTVETTTLDFKRCLYPLDLDKGKFDGYPATEGDVSATAGRPEPLVFEDRSEGLARGVIEDDVTGLGVILFDPSSGGEVSTRLGQ